MLELLKASYEEEIASLNIEILEEENSTPDRVWLHVLKGKIIGLETAIELIDKIK